MFAGLFQDDALTAMKDELNTVKERLSEYEILEWGRHTTLMNPASQVAVMFFHAINDKL